jgi:hypothetical protein
MRNVYVDFGKDDLINKRQPKENKIYFDGICYKGSFIKSGNKSRFLWSKDKDYGYKIFINNFPTNIPPTEEEVRSVFTIQKFLSDHGFSPKPYEVIRCEDKLREYFAIKTETVKWLNGMLKPIDVTISKRWVKRWVRKVEEFCKENEIRHPHQRFGEVGDPLDLNGGGNCMQSEKDNKIYLVDVDIRWRMG